MVFRPDQIHGRAAQRLGLDLSLGLTPRQFAALCEGYHPTTGKRLVKPAYVPIYEVDADGQPVKGADGRPVRAIDPDTGKPMREPRHTPAIDVYLAAPESVSLAAVVAETNPKMYQAIIKAHDDAVEATMRWSSSRSGTTSTSRSWSTTHGTSTTVRKERRMTDGDIASLPRGKALVIEYGAHRIVDLVGLHNGPWHRFATQQPLVPAPLPSALDSSLPTLRPVDQLLAGYRGRLDAALAATTNVA